MRPAQALLAKGTPHAHAVQVHGRQMCSISFFMWLSWGCLLCRMQKYVKVIGKCIADWKSLGS